MKPFAIAAALFLAAVSPQEMPQAAPVEQHAWLQQLVGEWTAKSEATMAPGAPAIKMESTESARSIGGLWIVAEGKASMGGVPLTTMMTLGYDPQKKAFVGSWIDSVQSNMWIYTGTLDEAKKVLTLATEGPSFSDPAKTAKYRDVIELKDKDHRFLTSSVQDEKGAWTTFMRAEYVRKK